MKNKKYDVIVVGGGASGMMAAITAARSGARTAILEHNNRVGKKILSTGNGKCNFTNELQEADCYRGSHPAFVMSALEQFGVKETIAFFEELGMFVKNKNGYYYPYSEQAANVLELFCMELERLHILIYLETSIDEIKKEKDTFYFQTNNGIFQSEACILATGGKAAKVTGSDGSGYEFVRKFGHHIIDVVPALVQLKAKEKFFKSLAGIRTDAIVHLLIDEKEVLSERGELQLTDYGISGIVVFQLSRYAAYSLKANKQVHAKLDFFPDWTEKDLFTQLIQRFWNQKKEQKLGDAVVGILNKKMLPVLLKQANLDADKQASALTKQEIKRFVEQLKQFKIEIIDTKPFENAQVSAGGVDCLEVNEQTLESKLICGLYFCGEILDIDGKCGGYNLQWAWSSGYAAGKHAAATGKESKF